MKVSSTAGIRWENGFFIWGLRLGGNVRERDHWRRLSALTEYPPEETVCSSTWMSCIVESICISQQVTKGQKDTIGYGLRTLITRTIQHPLFVQASNDRQMPRTHGTCTTKLPQGIAPSFFASLEFAMSVLFPVQCCHLNSISRFQIVIVS